MCQGSSSEIRIGTRSHRAMDGTSEPCTITEKATTMKTIS